MAHQESVLSPETYLLILMPARPFTALDDIMLSLCMSAHSRACVFYLCVHLHKSSVLKFRLT